MSTTVQKKVDLVIAIDTSESMADEAKALSAALNKATDDARTSCPSDLRVVFLGIEGTFADSQFIQTVRQYLTTAAGASIHDLKGRVQGSVSGAGAQEDLARAVEDICIHFDWRPGAEKNVFVLGDESLEGGEMVLDAARLQACDNAIATALAAGAKVHTYLGTPHADNPYPTPQDEEANIREYKRLALRTGGEHYIYTKGIVDFAQVLKNTICASRLPQKESIDDKKAEADALDGIARPVEETGTSPATPAHGADFCDSAPEIIRAVNTLADVLNKIVDICGRGQPNPSKPGCRCQHHAPPSETVPAMKPDNNTRPPQQDDDTEQATDNPPPVPPAEEAGATGPAEFVDKTMFTDGTWNGWVAGPAGHDIELANYAKMKTKGLSFKTAPGKNHAGTLLQKTLQGLNPGSDYIFLIRAKRVIGRYAPPRLSLSVDGHDISGITELINKEEWVTIQGTFRARAGSAVLEVISHENASDGNDFHIGRLVIANPGNQALEIQNG